MADRRLRQLGRPPSTGQAAMGGYTQPVTRSGGETSGSADRTVPYLKTDTMGRTRDREVMLDPVTRQLVDLGNYSGGRRSGYPYTTLEDTMQLLSAHRGNSRRVAAAWA